MKIRQLLLLTLMSMMTYSFAQQGEVHAKLDSTHILIGDYLNINFTVKVPSSVKVFFPTIRPEQLDSIELIGFSKIDTVINNNTATYKQTVTITAFDSGSFVFPAFSFYTKDSILIGITNPLPFEVTTLAVDTTLEIKDIQQPVKIPLTFKEIVPYILVTLAVLAIVALIIFLIIKYSKKEKHQKSEARPAIKIKPHLTALDELEKLRRKKLWEEGHVKRYYSELTDIIRTYMEERYQFGAMEMVTDEIMKELHQRHLPQEHCDMMKQILDTADLVKFAKWQPLPNDHDLCMKDAIGFVKNTADQGTAPTDNDKK